MSFPLSRSEAVAIVPNLEVSTTDNSVSATTLDTVIADETTKVKNIANSHGYSYASPTNHQIDLFSFLSQFPIWRNVIKKRIGNNDPALYFKINNILKNIENFFIQSFQYGEFNASWKSKTEIPSVQLCTELEASYEITSFKLTPFGTAFNVASKPMFESVTIYVKQWSAILYSYANQQGLTTPTDLSTIPSELRKFYKKISILGTSIFIFLIHLPSFGGSNAKDYLVTVDEIWAEVQTELELFKTNQKTYLKNA